MKKTILLFLLTSFLSLLLAGQKATLSIGNIAPAFSGTDQYGKKVVLKDLLKISKVIVVFYRGHWCPYCNRELIAIQDSLSMIHAKRAGVVAISPELPEYVEKTVQKTAATFPIISDKSHVIMDGYGVTTQLDAATQNRLKTVGIDLAVVNGSNGYILPIPAVFIINQNGQIDYIFFEPNHRIRPSVQQLLDHL
jgi:peroxiredoxin